MTRLLFIISFLLLTCKNENTLFVKLSDEKTGITFTNELTSTAELNILNYLYYYNGAGIAAGDFNNDGLIDLYFTGNQVSDKLYLNKGEFTFEDTTEDSGIQNETGWTTGVTTVDINNDGLLDIYICKVGKHLNVTGHNLLYINQGIENGIPKFKEKSKLYGLDYTGYSTQSSFFDYDLDGDLDMYLLNHSVHPNSNYGKGIKRTEIDSLSGDKFYENINGRYTDVTSQTGIFQGNIGYGLGISISDINNDGYPDIYVGNDFFENDYLYINQKDKSFKEIISGDNRKLGHTTHFSMGNAISDLNNDGYTDIISLDMLPEDLQTYKTSGLEYPYQTYQQYLKNGYSPQYMQNTLHLNLGNENFSETAFVSGISATEWSWAPLVADFDNDGYKDIFITNGILGATNDMDFINFISDEKIQKRLGKNFSESDLILTNDIPEKKTKNYFFKNNADNTFLNTSEAWSKPQQSFSNGAIHADLDNDGDLDIAVNNVNEKAYIFKNTSDNVKSSSNYLKIKFKGDKYNRFGIGAKTVVHLNEQKITYENFNTTGYLSSSDPVLNIGIGVLERIDSVDIIWPGGKYERLRNLDPNQELNATYSQASGNYYTSLFTPSNSHLSNIDTLFHFKHKDFHTIEFNRDPLIPFANTNNGPDVSIADVNNDGKEDLFISGGKTQASKIFVQTTEGKFNSVQDSLFQKDAINEDTSSVFFDADNDGYLDLLVVSGGNEFRSGKPLNPRLYKNINGAFTKDTTQFFGIEINASKVRAIDIDNDKDLDICITSDVIPWQFGKTPNQYIFENNGEGEFKDITSVFAKELQTIGNVKDFIWIDINGDSLTDLIAVGHWMPISILINNGKKLILQKNNGLSKTNGWWNTMKVADFDKDGDLDIIAGNWGLNSRLAASNSQPIKLYSNDFDDNGSIEPILTYYYQDIETPFASKDELVKQIPFLNKKYLSYKDFAKAKFAELLPVEKIKNAHKKEVYELATSYFENKGDNTFVRYELPFMAQITSVNDILVDDFNNDGFYDALLTGNNYEISTQLSRFDASHGVLLLNDTKGFFREAKNQKFNIPGPARKSAKLKINNQVYYIITINNNIPIFLKKNKKE